MSGPPARVRKVLLTYLAQTSVSKETPFRVDNRIKRTPSIGLLYIAEVLSRQGITVHVKDQTVEGFSLSELVNACQAERYDFIGFYSYTAIKENIIQVLGALKERGLGPVVIGGPGSMARQDYLRAGCDLVCEGEGEETVLEIVEYLEGKRELATVKGVSFSSPDSGKVVINAPRPPIHNLDEIPFPKRDYYPIDTYFDHHFFGMQLPYTTFVAGRGCPNDCTFCNSPQFWKRKLRVRSPQNVLEEIDFLVAEYGIRYVGFKDDAFGVKDDWLREFCHGMIARSYDLRWSCMTHPHSLRRSRRELLTLMQRAGLDALIAGLQSSDPRVLERINRRADEPGELAKTVTVAKELGITTGVEFIVGLPGDDEKAFQANLSYVFDTLPHYALFFPLCVLDGSAIDQEFPDRDFCSFSSEEVLAKVSEAYRRYYSSPRVIAQNLAHIAKKEPMWFLRASTFATAIVREMFFQGM